VGLKINIAIPVVQIFMRCKLVIPAICVKNLFHYFKKNQYFYLYNYLFNFILSKPIVQTLLLLNAAKIIFTTNFVRRMYCGHV